MGKSLHFLTPSDPEADRVLDAFVADALLTADRDDLHPSEVPGVSRFRFEGAYTMDEFNAERELGRFI